MELYKGIYRPEFTELLKERNAQIPPRDLKEITSFNPKRPLNEEEAAIVEERLQQLREQNARVLSKAEKQKEEIERLAGSFTVDARLSRRPKLKRAMQKLFGYISDEITFDMYRQALETKRRLEIEEAEELFED